MKPSNKPKWSPEIAPESVRDIEASERDNIAISATPVDGKLEILSKYKDPCWRLNTKLTNRSFEIDFQNIPTALIPSAKEVMYRYIKRGRTGGKPPQGGGIYRLFYNLLPFLKHLESHGVDKFSRISEDILHAYVRKLKAHRTKKGTPYAPSSLDHLFGAVEALYDLSQYTSDVIECHPWPGTSARHLAGMTGARNITILGRKTPIIPDDIFASLFQGAYEHVELGDKLLNLRDALDELRRNPDDFSVRKNRERKKRLLREAGFTKGMPELTREINYIRAACYIVVASVTGCRNHELSLLQTGACFSTEEPHPTDANCAPLILWWMRSISTKTDAGPTTWLIPEAGVKALRLMERWALNYQALICEEVAERRRINARDPEIAEALRHSRALFLARSGEGTIRTVKGQRWTHDLRDFASNRCGVDWPLASHQFRRTFAHYAAKSQYGDLRYLKEHFKHWSIDMTLGYALDDTQDMSLYLEIQGELDEIKLSVVDKWVQPDVPLAGGYGAGLIDWRGKRPVTMFKSHRHMVRSLAESTSIRTNGHAWCTADDNLCVGNDLERTRCTNCENAVIGLQHAPIYAGLYNHLQEVAKCDDVGDGGLKLVERDMARCRSVLDALGLDALVTLDGEQ